MKEKIFTSLSLLPNTKKKLKTLLLKYNIKNYDILLNLLIKLAQTGDLKASHNK